MEQDPSTENNVVLDQTTAQYKRFYTEAASNSCIKTTEHLNFDKMETGLWKLARSMGDKNSASSPVDIEHNNKLLSGKQVAPPLYEQLPKSP